MPEKLPAQFGRAWAGPAAAAESQVRRERRNEERRKAGRRSSDLLRLDRELDITDLYCRYFPKVFAYVFSRIGEKDTSRDITSDAFEKALINLDSLRSPDSFGSWLFAIVRNEVNAHFRSSKRAQQVAQEALMDAQLSRERPGPEEISLHLERRSLLWRLIKQLSRREQEVIALKFHADLSSREIADILGTSTLNVRVTVCRALTKLRSRIAEIGDDFRAVAANEAA